MSTVVLLLATGLGLGALYFLVASGLSLIYGLMGVLNFAHGSFLTLGAFAGWETARRLGGDSWGSLLLSLLVGAGVGALAAVLTELLLVDPQIARQHGGHDRDADAGAQVARQRKQRGALGAQ